MGQDRFDKRFEERYEFRLANRGDIEAIMRYIDQCWRKGHILSRNREMFEYEFCEGEDVHFLLAVDRETGEIEGLDGYYYTSSRRSGDFDVWGSMWSVRKDHRNLPMLGIAIANHYYKILGYRYEIGLGVNARTATPLQRDHFKVQTGLMKHYYMLKERDNYTIARIASAKVTDADQHRDTLKLLQVEDRHQIEQIFDFEEKITTYPYKDGWYVDHRFFQHPVYHYDVYLIVGERAEAEALIVLRRVQHAGRNVLRIVDYMGKIESLPAVQHQLYDLMDADSEYIDFYCYGYDEQSILDAGFVERMPEDNNIIPNYFEPFEQKNVDCWYNSDAKENFRICKADADQDRPNMVEE